MKLIEVKPNASLSLQMHHHRAEHWVVVNGTALVEKDGEKQLLSENESTFIPLGCKPVSYTHLTLPTILLV